MKFIFAVFTGAIFSNLYSKSGSNWFSFISGDISLTLGSREIKLSGKYTSFDRPILSINESALENVTTNNGFPSSPSSTEFSRLVSAMLPASFKRAEIKAAKLLKVSLLLDATDKPDEEIVWRTLIAEYEIERGVEHALSSTIAHASMAKVKLLDSMAFEKN